VPRGVVRESGGGVYRVALTDGRIVDAALRGRLKQEPRTGDRVVIGDRVRVESADAHSFTIEEVEPRETVVARRGSGGRRPKVLAANVERMIVVVAAARPEPATPQIDRLLVIAESNGLAPVLVVNKVDLPDTGETVAELEGLYRGIGCPVYPTSVLDGTGMEPFRDLVCEGTSALVGPSGVGKSSLLNAIDPDLGLRVGELSERVSRGRHTTVSARLVGLSCGGLVADTPGFGDVGVWGVRADDLDRCFPELAAVRGECRFEDCVHLLEPDCAVKASVERGSIAPSRYESYRSLMNEALEEGADPGGG
jgi:ribosome biogenesis GTPase